MLHLNVQQHPQSKTVTINVEIVNDACVVYVNISAPTAVPFTRKVQPFVVPLVSTLDVSVNVIGLPGQIEFPTAFDVIVTGIFTIGSTVTAIELLVAVLEVLQFALLVIMQ